MTKAAFGFSLKISNVKDRQNPSALSHPENDEYRTVDELKQIRDLNSRVDFTICEK
jgi:hypothetical protein